MTNKKINKQFLKQLKFYSNYETDKRNHIIKPLKFTCEDNKEYYAEFRVKYKLDRFINANDDEDTVKKILRWTYEILLHSTYYENTINYKSSIDIIEFSRANKLCLNCYCHSYVLKDALCSVGITARLVYCMPINGDYYGNHVIVEYYSKNHQKWIFVDPTYNVLFTNKRGVPVSLLEFRENIIKNRKNLIVINNRIQPFSSEIKRRELYRGYCEDIIPLLVMLQYERITEESEVEYIRLVAVNYCIKNKEKKIDNYIYTSLTGLLY
ncbi:MAG: transglutaminase domain-containing protein [Clostridia bacterium]|nr:transglutaminase domain-containing protein [Clostridia bacterium]